MYTNIDTDYALWLFKLYFYHTPACKFLPIQVIFLALEIIMKYNLFQFGYTYWKQISGVTMGVPPVCCFAMLYYSIHKQKLLPRCPSQLPFYRHYIDGGLGIWYHALNKEDDTRAWNAFKTATPFGKIHWKVEP